MRGVISPLPQHAFMAWCLVKRRDNFIFTLILHIYALTALKTLNLLTSDCNTHTE
jgi:hypothetical protein